MKTIYFSRLCAIALILSSCTVTRLPTHGWQLVSVDENILGYHHVFQSIPTGRYILKQQADTLMCQIGDSVKLYGYKRIKRIENIDTN